MATAFGGMFLGKNVLTIRANSNPPWIAKWNGADIRRKWKVAGSHWRRRRGKASYQYNYRGARYTITMHGNHIEVGLSYGVTYKASRHHWNRQNWKISGIYYTDFYMNNQFWCNLCARGSFKGEAIELPHHRWHWRPAGDDKMVWSGVDLFQKSQAQIVAVLDQLNAQGRAALLEGEDAELIEDNLTENVTIDTNFSVKAECTGKALEEAQKSCAVLKKEKTEEEKEEVEEDAEAKANQDATYQACIADACDTGQKDFGNAGKEEQEESEMQTALKFKKEFKVVAANEACKEGWMLTDPNENILSDEEKTRAQKKKDDCTNPCKLCRPKHRRYLAGPLVLHNETRAACIHQRLAMPKYPEDIQRLWALQKEHCTADKAWVGAKFKGGSWKWDDDSTVTGVADANEGDYLCIDKDEGSLVNCEHGADEKNDALCEGVWY